MSSQRPGHDDAGFFGGFRFPGPGAEITQRYPPALPNHLLRDLVHRCQHAADPARDGFIGNRTVRYGEVGLFEAVVANVLELEVIHPRGGSAIKRRIDQRPDDVPDLREAFARRLAHGRGMLVPEHRPDTDRYRVGNSEDPTAARVEIGWREEAAPPSGGQVTRTQQLRSTSWTNPSNA